MLRGQKFYLWVENRFSDSEKIPINRSEAPSRDQLKKEKSFVESVGKFYAYFKNSLFKVQYVKLSSEKTETTSETGKIQDDKSNSD